MAEISEQKKYMHRAIKLAELGRGFTDPNPVVGAVIVKDGEVIGEGYHERYGELHAERNALSDCRNNGLDPAGADIYVTLEPCCHHGKTPPCTDAIIESGIRHVYIGSDDPNPEVAHKSARVLDEAGISCTRGILKDECDALNEKFFHYISSGLPYVTLKYAMTADGKIASASGKSQWITGEPAREHVHRLRHEHTGIMVGIGTVLADDPMLSCRLKDAGPLGPSDPVRIIVDSTLRLPADSKIARSAKNIRTIIATLPLPPKSVSYAYTGSASGIIAKAAQLKDLGCEILEIGSHAPDKCEKPAVDIRSLMETLGKMKISSVLVEGGGTLAYSVLQANSVNRVCAYVAPKILGGARAKTPVEGIGFDGPDSCVHMEFASATPFGEDILLQYIISSALTDRQLAGDERS